jgi:hypothetical protein
MSVLLRPDARAAVRLDLVAREAVEAAGGHHWLTRAAVSSHLTLRSLEPWRDKVEDDDPLVRRYADALAVAADGVGPLTFTIVGVTLTPGSVMACAVPADAGADRLADAYGKALGADGWHENEFDRDIWYLNLVHFAGPIEAPDRLIEWVADHRHREIATVVVHEVQLAQWRFTGNGMTPHALATVTLSRS